MLSEINYSGIFNEERVSKLNKEIKDLELISKVSGGLTQLLGFTENKHEVSYVKDIQTHSNGGCIIIFENHLENLFDVLKKYWSRLPEETKERISIMFSGNMDDIRTVSVYWRSETGFSTNDIADIVEKGLFM
jgi:hypothetical protein